MAWRRTDASPGHGLGRLARDDDGWVADGAEVLGGGEDVLSCSFRIHLDGAWRTRRAEVVAVSAYGRRAVTLEAGDGRWEQDGRRVPALDGCVDVDVAATPLTNTFPVRRLGLAVGESATSPVAWIDVPTLAVSRVDQTYRRLGERTWEYADPTFGAFAIEVDDDGLVIEYAGFATRV